MEAYDYSEHTGSLTYFYYIQKTSSMFKYIRIYKVGTVIRNLYIKLLIVIFKDNFYFTWNFENPIK